MSKEQKTPSVLYSKSWRGLEVGGWTEQGLSSSEAQKRLAEFGHNELEEGEKKNLLVKFIEQFKDLMIIILVAAAIRKCNFWWGEDILDAIHYPCRGYHQRCLVFTKKEKQKKPSKPPNHV